MALSTVFRRASSTVATLAFRAAARTPVTFRSGAVSAERLILGSQLGGRSISSFSTESAFPKKTEDDNLISILESVIERALEEKAPRPNENMLEDKPEGFPFEIIDTPGGRYFWLKRKFEDENIQLLLDIYSYMCGDGNSKSGMQVFVSVAKGEGACLEFKGYLKLAGDFEITSVSIKKTQNELPYEGPYLHLSSNLGKAFHRYLEIRGIESSFAKFLLDYFNNKESKEDVQWFKDLKSFLDK